MFHSNFLSFFVLSNHLLKTIREEINNLHTNVEYLSNRITSASSVIADSNINVNEAYQASNLSSNLEPITTASSPKNFDAISYSTTSMPLAASTYEDDNVNNYSISNDMSSYEPTARIETPPKRNSIKNVINDDEYEAPTYYNEPTSYVDQQPAGNPCY